MEKFTVSPSKIMLGTYYIFYLNYDGKRLSVDEMENDIKNMRRYGICNIALNMMWADIHIKPDEYDLERADLVLDLAQKYRLKVSIGLMRDVAPAWALKKYPNGRYVSEKGEVSIESGGRELLGSPGMCHDCPDVSKEVRKFYQEIVKQYKDHPALSYWDAWLEFWSDPNIYGTAEGRNLSFCYCKYTVAKFQNWLKVHYTSLKELNSIWGSTFLAWERVEPPRYGHRTVPAWLDWKHFLIENQAGLLKKLVRNIREIDSEHPITCHCGLSSIASKGKSDFASMPLTTLADDWKIASHVDFYGLSVYPVDPYTQTEISAQEAKEVSEAQLQKVEERKQLQLDLDVARNLDGVRSAASANGKDFFVAELPGRFDVGLFKPSTNKDYLKTQKIWSWMALARKSNGLVIYEWRDIIESLFAPGWGLCDIEGESTERTKSFGELVKDIERIEYLLKGTEVEKPQIGILFNPLSYIYDWIVHQSYSRDSLLGYYKAFWFSNYPIDFVHIEDLNKPLDYRVLYIPYPIIMDEDICRNIERYIESGGRVVTEALYAAKDRHGTLRRRLASNAVIGLFQCRPGEITSQKEIILNKDAEKISPLLEGVKLPVSVCTQIIDPVGKGEVIGEYFDGSPAIILGTSTIIAGSFLGLAYDQTEDENLKNFILSMAKWAGVKPTVEVDNIPKEKQIEVRILKGKKYYLCFVMNHSMRTLNPLLRLNIPLKEYKVEEILKGKHCKCEYKDNRLYVEIKINNRDISVLKISE